MSDDLVKRLRESGSRSEVELHEDREDAADRIEELEERLKAAVGDAKEAEAYAEELEAKLAKAMDALQVIEDASRFFARDRESANTETLSYAHETTRRLCSTTLAEMKGEKDE